MVTVMKYSHLPPPPDPPHIVSFQSLTNTTTITAQSSLILQCDVVTLFPPLTSLVIARTWNGVTVLVAVANVSSYRVTYYVRPSQVNDSGVYWCNASSSAGNDSSELTVIVKGDTFDANVLGYCKDILHC